MKGRWESSLARARGVRPLLVAAALLVLTEVALWPAPVWRQATELTDRLWLDRKVTSRLEQVWPAHHNIAEAPMLEAYLRALRRHPARTKVLIVGDSLIWQVPRRPSFSERLRPELVHAYDDNDIVVSAWATPGLSPAAAYYLIKKITAETRPALLVYLVNPIWLGQEYANVASPNISFLDARDPAPGEGAAYQALIHDTHPEKEESGGWAGFTPAHWYYRVRYGSRLRALMLPPAVFGGLGPRCYFLDCQDVHDTYWRDLWAKGKRGQKLTENYRRFIFDQDRSVNYRFVLMITELAKYRGVRLAVLVPPRNPAMLELMGVRDSVYGAGDELAARLGDRGVFVINCQTAAAEEHFRDDQHLRGAGFDDWVGCIAPPLEDYIHKSPKEGKPGP